MPNFSYVAVDDLGARVKGTAAAQNEDALEAVLRDQGRHLVSASVAGERTNLSEIRILERVTRRDVIFFTSQLATVISTGLNLVEGLEALEGQTQKLAMRRTVQAMRRDIESGLSLSEALSRHPKVFTDLYVNIVRAGEAYGKVDHSLQDLVRHLEWHEELKSRIREIMTYPIIVIVMLTVLCGVLVGFTIPRFTQIYERLAMQVELPAPTRAVMAVSDFMRNDWYIVLLAIIAATIAVRLYRQTREGSVRISQAVLKIPLVGELVRKVALSRFAHYFGTLHENGLEVAPSLAIIQRVIGNPYLSFQFEKAVSRVMAGESLSRALRQTGEFPPVVIQVLALGERTGRMHKALQDVRVYFDGEIDRTIRRTLTLVGPILLVVLAAVFVTMALAFYLPLFQLLGAVR